MKDKDFLGEVHVRAHLSDLEEAVRATGASLPVLGARLTKQERSDYSAQLPE